MEKLLVKVSIIISKYQDMGNKLVFDDAMHLSVLLKDLTSSLFFLEKYRDDASRRFNTIIHNEIKNGSSVSGAEIKAKEAVPELYQLRRLMTSAYRVADAIRSNISFLKQEK